MSATAQTDTAFGRIVERFARKRDVRTGRMFSGHDLRVNGKIFAMRSRSGFVVKVAARAR